MRFVKRWLKIVVGVIVLIVGLILMPMPGPGGTPVTLVGLAILSSDMPWAQRLFDQFRASRRNPRHRTFWACASVGLVIFWIASSYFAWRAFKR